MALKTVFLRSTGRDLADYREAAYRAIEGLDGYHCVRMEDFGARDWVSDDFCRARVAACDLFVGIVGHLYGSCPQGSQTSYVTLGSGSLRGQPPSGPGAVGASGTLSADHPCWCTSSTGDRGHSFLELRRLPRPSAVGAA